MKLPIDLELINPERNKKYSPELFKWLKKAAEKVWSDAEIKVFRDSEMNVLWIGYITWDKCFMGCRLISAMASGGKKQAFCWSNKINDLTEVEFFWENYLRVGRCAIDTKHNFRFVNENLDRWKFTGENHRKCLWCGERQNRYSKRITRTEFYWA